MVAPNGPGPPPGGKGRPAQAAAGGHGGLAGDDGSQWPRPTRWGVGSPFHVVVGAYEGLARDGVAQRPGPNSWRDGDSCQGGGWCLWRVCGGWGFPKTQAHQLGGRGVLPKRRSVPMDYPWGTPCPSSQGRPFEGKRSPAQASVGAYGVPAGDGSSQQPGPTS